MLAYMKVVFGWLPPLVVLALTGACMALSLDPQVRREYRLRSEVETNLERILGADTRFYSISLRDRVSGFRMDINENRKYPSASTMKIAVMMVVYRLAQKGELSLEERVPVRNAFTSVVDGSEYQVPPETLRSCPYRTFKRLGQAMSLRELCADMIESSSNLATNLILQHVGVDRIQRELDDLEISGTRIIRGLYDERAFDRNWHNQLTARGVEETLEALLRSDNFRKDLRMEMLSVMASTCAHHRERIPAYLPADVVVAQKGGTTEDVLHDAGIIYPRGQAPFILVILTEGYISRARVDDRMAFVARYLYDTVMNLRREQAEREAQAAAVGAGR